MSSGQVRVLLIENDFRMIAGLAAALRGRGCEIFPADTIDSAAALLRALDGNIDFVLSDVWVESGRLPEQVPHSQYADTTIGIGLHVRDNYPGVQVYFMSRSHEQEPVRWLKKQGFDVLPAPRVGALDGPGELAESALQLFRDRKRPTAFIVHGHDHGLRDALHQYLTQELQFGRVEILAHTANVGRTIIEKFEQTAVSSDIAFVLMTADDHFRRVSDDAEVFRARQNVILELGFFLALLRRASGRILVLRDPKTEKLSDIDGVVWIDVSAGLDSVKPEIVRELQAVGLI